MVAEAACPVSRKPPAPPHDLNERCPEWPLWGTGLMRRDGDKWRIGEAALASIPKKEGQGSALDPLGAARPDPLSLNRLVAPPSIGHHFP